MITYGSLVVYVNPRGRRYIKRLQPNEDWHSNDGTLSACAVVEANYGDVVFTSEQRPIRVEAATLMDMLMGIKRQTQIIYPKDIAYICLRLGAGPGRTIVEAGCGSGGLTLALSWFCGPTGRVVSCEAREEFARLGRRNLNWAGLGENVEIFHQDVSEGFPCDNADALFLDMREPWLALPHASHVLRPGAVLGFLLPTVGQVSELCAALEQGPFGEVEVCELLLRHWKPLPDRLRPQDRMAAHTGFLIFCRLQSRSQAFDSARPRGTRERKQDAARELRDSVSGNGPLCGAQ